MINNNVTLVGITRPIVEGVFTAEEFVAYCARVSNPTNQLNNDTSGKLLKYLIEHKHWSPFEMVSVVMHIQTTRDIGRQILRHRSFSFQEFSQRYAKVGNQMVTREARTQDPKNRQNSIVSEDPLLQLDWQEIQSDVADYAYSAYEEAIAKGIAKEQARALLPEGLSPTSMYMHGSLRSWIHYYDVRRPGSGTQAEHSDIAQKAWDILTIEMPSLNYLFSSDE